METPEDRPRVRWWEIEDRAPLPNGYANSTGLYMVERLTLEAWRHWKLLDRPHP